MAFLMGDGEDGEGSVGVGVGAHGLFYIDSLLALAEWKGRGWDRLRELRLGELGGCEIDADEIDGEVYRE